MRKLILNLLPIYQQILGQGQEQFSNIQIKRILTIPSEGVRNNGYDNINYDLILRVNDEIINYDKNLKIVKSRYLIMDMLGKGTFGQVVKTKEQLQGKIFAVKVIKSKQNYFNQGRIEVDILKQLRIEQQKFNINRIVKIQDRFIFRNHLCLVFELLDCSLYNYLQATQFVGMDLKTISNFTKQILEGLILTEKLGIIHCDLKPENLLFDAFPPHQLKIIDFGSACYENEVIYSYIQSRFYRAPEVILGYMYNKMIDMWSLGCICIELYLGYPILPGNSYYDQLRRIFNLLGSLPPNDLIQQSPKKDQFFNYIENQDEKYEFKKPKQYIAVKPIQNQYIKYQQEQEAKGNYTIEPNMDLAYEKLNSINDLEYYFFNGKFRNKNLYQHQQEFDKRYIFFDFLTKLLQIDPRKRMSASQAISHPFIQFSKYIDGSFSSDINDTSPNENSQSNNISYVSQLQSQAYQQYDKQQQKISKLQQIINKNVQNFEFQQLLNQVATLNKTKQNLNINQDHLLLESLNLFSQQKNMAKQIQLNSPKNIGRRSKSIQNSQSGSQDQETAAKTNQNNIQKQKQQNISKFMQPNLQAIHQQPYIPQFQQPNLNILTQQQLDIVNKEIIYQEKKEEKIKNSNFYDIYDNFHKGNNKKSKDNKKQKQMNLNSKSFQAQTNIENMKNKFQKNQ